MKKAMCVFLLAAVACSVLPGCEKVQDCTDCSRDMDSPCRSGLPISWDDYNSVGTVVDYFERCEDSLTTHEGEIVRITVFLYEAFAEIEMTDYRGHLYLADQYCGFGTGYGIPSICINSTIEEGAPTINLSPEHRGKRLYVIGRKTYTPGIPFVVYDFMAFDTIKIEYHEE